MFPLSLQSIISNQMRPRRLRGAWFSRLLRHPARRRSGSILSPGTHTGYMWELSTTVTVLEFTCTPSTPRAQNVSQRIQLTLNVEKLRDIDWHVCNTVAGRAEVERFSWQLLIFTNNASSTNSSNNSACSLVVEIAGNLHHQHYRRHHHRISLWHDRKLPHSHPINNSIQHITAGDEQFVTCSIKYNAIAMLIFTYSSATRNASYRPYNGIAANSSFIRSYQKLNNTSPL